jgi:hypothetical protein
MWRRCAVLATAGLAACFTSVSARHFAGPDGRTNWWSIECQLDDSLCWRQASEQCPSGYDAVDLSPSGTALVYARKTRTAEMFGERRVNGGKLIIHCTDGLGAAGAMGPSVDDVTPPPWSAGDAGATRPLKDQR